MTTTGNPTKARKAIAAELELRCFRDLYDAAPADVRRAMGWRCESVGGALVSVAKDAPTILFNRVLGLGVRQPASRETIDDILRLYVDTGVERFFVHVRPEASPPEVGDWLVERGLEPQRRWMKFERDAAPAPEAKTALRIGPVTEDHGLAFGRVVANAFDLGAAAAGLFPALVGRPSWQLQAAFDGDELVGAGIMFIHGEYAYVAFGATAPTHRGRGAQGAVLAARIEAARALGCTLLFTETGEEVPGEAQHSYRNIERAGFVPAYTIANYARPR